MFSLFGFILWNLLGQFRFSADKSSEIQVSNREVSADRVVIADAVRFVPVPEGESVVEITQAELHLQHQEKVFSTLRKQFQPKWANTPVLSWKRKRGILKGKVTDADGVPAYNSVVKLQTNPPHMVKTDVHGAFAFMNLAPGQYVVEFSDQKRNTVRVESGQVAAKFHSLK